jgi:hypothetical protein
VKRLGSKAVQWQRGLDSEKEKLYNEQKARIEKVRQKWFRVDSATDEICSAYAQFIFIDCFEIGCNSPFYAQHALKLVTRWLSIHKN